MYPKSYPKLKGIFPKNELFNTLDNPRINSIYKRYELIRGMWLLLLKGRFYSSSC
ncbi:hypothetical protein FITA111629_07405 [Filibacter tadaridae]|uniref:Uncharacterized protein n=1 Tax=Filibacter tadaridae TaxID=2483811 RepID=A0A3P5X2G4_9BACL|nr:hypothetical protein FILTAD_01755 [Filibacter tadaridae]